MSLKTLLTLAVAAVFLGVAGLSNTAVAGYNRGGHLMNGNECDADELTCQDDNVLYDNGDGNGGEDVDGNTLPSEDDSADVDPLEPDEDAAADAEEAAAEAEAEAAEAAAEAAEAEAEAAADAAEASD